MGDDGKGGRGALPFRFAGGTGYLLARAGAESRRRWAAMLVEHGLTPYDYGVLLGLDELGATGQGDLAARLGVDRRNMVAIVDRIVGRGLVERRPHERDRRRRALVLTATGQGLARDLVEHGARLENELLAGLGARDRVTLRRLLLAVLDE